MVRLHRVLLRLVEMLPRQVLVHLGVHRRVVEFEKNDDLKPAIFRSFSDVPGVANSTMVIQLKDNEWGGEFVDLMEDQNVPDHSVLNVIFEVGQKYLPYRVKL